MESGLCKVLNTKDVTTTNLDYCPNYVRSTLFDYCKSDNTIEEYLPTSITFKNIQTIENNTIVTKTVTQKKYLEVDLSFLVGLATTINKENFFNN